MRGNEAVDEEAKRRTGGGGAEGSERERGGEKVRQWSAVRRTHWTPTPELLPLTPEVEEEQRRQVRPEREWT